MSKRVDAVRRVFKRSGALSDDNIQFLFDSIRRLEGSLLAVQKKLSACNNLSAQKDAMIAKRDRSIAKAHVYIETLKDELRNNRDSQQEKGNA